MRQTWTTQQRDIIALICKARDVTVEYGLPEGVGLWAGFLDRTPVSEAIAAARDIEAAGLSTIWSQEYSGVDPFIRAALYLQATDRLTVALAATIHARDPEAMVAAAATVHEAFGGRFALGLGVSHHYLAEARGTTYERPLSAMRSYLGAMTPRPVGGAAAAVPGGTGPADDRPRRLGDRSAAHVLLARHSHRRRTGSRRPRPLDRPHPDGRLARIVA